MGAGLCCKAEQTAALHKFAKDMPKSPPMAVSENPTDFRQEADTFGPIKVPADRYWGA